MLSAYTASVEFIASQKDVMGPGHACVARTQVSEVANLLSIIRTTSPCRSDITALMKFVTADKSLAFTEPQQQRLMEAASIRLSSTVVDDGTSPIHFDMHGPSKGQTHMCSFNYYNDDDWGFFGGPEPFR